MSGSLNVLVIGSGGREHALCWKIAQSPLVKSLYAAPGNPGMAQVAQCVDSTDFPGVAESIRADLTIVGPEAPLAAGIVDRFRERGHAIVGPTALAARLESSKAFAKDFMRRAGIPTARYATAADIEEARGELRSFDYPVVLKADGLAAGKGVIIAADSVEAERAAGQLLTLGARLVIEEFLEGEEVSFIVLSDGRGVLALDPTQDHKAIHDCDQGPNTGGMGAYCDGRILTEAEKGGITETIVQPAIERMTAEGTPFTGFLYAGLMMTSQGPKVLEFNARLGDPETQVLMHRMESDFVEALYAAAHEKLAPVKLKWRSDPSVCVVLAAAGYPEAVRTGDAISGLEYIDGAIAFHAGTKLVKDALVTSGGRVLGITASGRDLESAIDKAYAEANKVHFHGMQFRRDIGHKGLRRWQRS